MPDDTTLPENGGSHSLPAVHDDLGPVAAMPLAMRIWFDDRLFDRAKLIAKYISEAEGFTPPHLLGKTAACFAVVVRSLTWRLDPYAVAKATYQTPGGQVGYFGTLCQAILENSGQLDGNVKYEHYGDWSKIKGKYDIRKSEKGKDYAVPTWTRADAKGLGVKVKAQVKGEAEMREWEFDLDQAFPLNSTLWATDPKTQICYTAVRRFSSVAAPGLFMGVPFDREDEAAGMIDVTPRPQREDYVDQYSPAGYKPGGGEKTVAGEQQTEPAADTGKKAAQREQYEVVDAEGEVQRYPSAAKATSAFEKLLEQTAPKGGQALEDLWEANGLLLTQLRETGKTKTSDMLSETYRQHIETIDRQAREATDAKAKGSTATPAAASAVSPSEGQRAEGAKNEAPPPAATKPKAAPKPAVAWTWKHPGYLDNPQSPLNGGGKIRFVSWLADMLREAPEDQIAAFIEAQTRELAFYKEKGPDDYRKLAEIAKGRGFQL